MFGYFQFGHGPPFPIPFLCLATEHAIVIARHEVNQPACRGKRFARYSKSPKCFANTYWLGNLERDDQIRLRRHLHRGLPLVVKTADNGIGMGESCQETRQGWVRVHELFSHVFSELGSLRFSRGMTDVKEAVCQGLYLFTSRRLA